MRRLASELLSAAPRVPPPGMGALGQVARVGGVCVCVYVSTRAPLPRSADQLQSRRAELEGPQSQGTALFPTVMIREVRQPLPPLPYNCKGA